MARRAGLGKHLCLPYTPGSAGEFGFGDVYIDQLTSQMVADWRARMGSLVKSGVVSPRTVNEYINKLRLIMSLAHRREFTSRNPCLDLKHLPTNPTYTEEEPNSLTPAETAVLLEKIWEVYPEWYAYSVLGFTTGLRPSSLRPLRRAGLHLTSSSRWARVTMCRGRWARGRRERVSMCGGVTCSETWCAKGPRLASGNRSHCPRGWPTFCSGTSLDSTKRS